MFRSTAVALGLVLLTALALLLPGLDGAPFDDPGEGMHAEITREILLSRDWVTLHLNGVRYFDKPALLYWVTGLSMRVFGPTEWAARVCSVLGAAAALAATVFLGARLLSPRAGLLAGLGLLTSAGFFAYARYLRPETLFVAAIQWGFGLLLLGGRNARGLSILGCACLGIAALAKDPLGTIGPLAAITLARALAGRLRPFSNWLPWGGIALLVALPGFWYLLVELRNPGFLWYTVVDNHLLNVVRARHFPDEDVPLSGVEFLAVAGLGASPWILPAALSVAGLLRERAWRKQEEIPWVTLAIWALGVFVLFALAPFKLPHYGLPAYPALALLAARWWETTKSVRAMLAIHLVAFALVAIGLAWVYRGDGEAFTGWAFGATDVYTRKEAALGQAAPFPEWGALRRLVGGTALIFGTGSLALLAAALSGSRGAGLSVIVVTLLLWLPLVARAEALVAAKRSVRAVALEVSRRAGPGDLLVHEGPLENSGALEFYGGLRPRILDGRTSVLGFGATFPDARETFWTRSELAEAWRGSRRVFLLTIRAPSKSVVTEFGPSEVHPLAVVGGRWLYSNRPRRARPRRPPRML